MNFYSLLLFTIIVIGLYRVYCIVLSHIYLKKTSKSIRKSKETTIWVVIPLLHEQKMIPDLLKLAAETASEINIKWVFITTEKEKPNEIFTGEQKLTTKQTLEKEMVEGGHTNAELLHLPWENKVCAEQLNYFLKQYSDSILENDILAFYNADSRFDVSSLQQFSNTLSSGAQLLHQPAVFLSNFESLLSRRKLICASFGIHQTIWTLADEIPRMIQRTTDANFLLPGAPYTVLHGMIKKKNTLIQ